METLFDDLKHFVDVLVENIQGTDKELSDIAFSTIVYLSFNFESHGLIFWKCNPLQLAIDKIKLLSSESPNEIQIINALRLTMQLLAKWTKEKKDEYFKKNKGSLLLLKTILKAANASLLHLKIISLSFGCLFYIIEVEFLRDICARQGIIARCYDLLVTS